jgi:hypothetical protein
VATLALPNKKKRQQLAKTEEFPQKTALQGCTKSGD